MTPPGEASEGVYSRDMGRGNSRTGGGLEGTGCARGARRAAARRPGAARRRRPERAEAGPRPRGACNLWERDETCPVSTEGGTRRVRLVREGGGGRQPRGGPVRSPDCMSATTGHPRCPASHAALAASSSPPSCAARAGGVSGGRSTAGPWSHCMRGGPWSHRMRGGRGEKRQGEAQGGGAKGQRCGRAQAHGQGHGGMRARVGRATSSCECTVGTLSILLNRVSSTFLGSTNTNFTSAGCFL